MKRPFSFLDSGYLLHRFEEWQEETNRIVSRSDYLQRAIREAAEHCIAAEMMAVLRDIPVEEVNRDRHGIRVKVLRAGGFTNYAELMAASEQQLSSLRGISEEGAALIKQLVRETAEPVRASSRLKLSADHRTDETTQIIELIYRYQKSKALREELAKLTNSYAADISEARQNLERGNGFFRWLFLGKEKKLKAIDAYRYLDETAKGNYVIELTRLSDEDKKLNACMPSVAWEDFLQHPIAYINILEELVPELLGNGDSVYGLPEELARQVQDECFFPDGLLCDLRRYQEWGVKYILHQGKVLLGDEMGLGKTIQAIATMVSLKNTGSTHFVVVCPASVVLNWCREVQKFSKLRVVKVHGAGRQAALEDWIDKGGVAVTTYETTMHWKLPEEFHFALLVVDEAHYIKNSEARRSVYTRALANRGERLLFMTGTALENNVGEMIQLISVLRPEIARSVSGMQMLSSAKQFRETVAPVYYRRKREDVLTELPELIEQESWCQLGLTERMIYEDVVLGKNYHEARRVSWNVENLKDSCKAERLLEILKNAEDEGRKVLVFSFYLDTIQKIARLLGSRCMEPINGSMSPAKRQEIIDAFHKAPAGQVLPAQMIAGGTGLNIQSASVVVLCEPQLKPSIERQAISRAYRMGQARNVLVYRLLAAGTVDEKVMDLLTEKQAIFDAFADKSIAAENMEVDNKTFGNIIQEEIDRINQLRETGTPGQAS